MGCKTSCNKKSSCTCMCDEKSTLENCNTCVNQESITFSGICNDPSQFLYSDDYWTDFTITGTIAVPSVKPSIEEVDSISTKVEILSKKTVITPVGPSGPVKNYEGKWTTGKKLVIEGLICIGTSYVALTADQSVHSFHGQIPFSAFIILPTGSCVDFDYVIDSCIESLCVTKICERTVDITASLILKAKPITSDCNSNIFDESGLECTSNIGFTKCVQRDCFDNDPVITGVCSAVDIGKLLIDGGQKWTEISIPELLTIPEAKPDILQLLTVVSRVEIMCQKVIETPVAVENYQGNTLTGYKLLVHALLRQRITYTSTSECKSVHSAHYDIPISAYIVLPPKTELTTKYKIKACIEDIFACPLNERQVFKNTTLFIKAEEISCLV